MIPFDVAPSQPADSHEVALPTRTDASRVWEFHDEYVLGTSLDVLVNSQSAEFAARAARVVRSEIDRLERVFNRRRADSELSQLNRARQGRVSPELFALVQSSEQWRVITRGAFDGRLGALLQLWSTISSPTKHSVPRVLENVRHADIKFQPALMRIELPHDVALSLDAIAKGFIVDAALNAARRSVPAIDGIAVSIGGDVRCWGAGPDCGAWRIGIPDPHNMALNAPLVDAVMLRNAAIATSGRGPRDCVGNTLRSTTISPLTGEPVRDIVSASVVASHAMDADAIATACMVLDPRASIAMVEQLEGVAARITDSRGQVHVSSAWPLLQLAAASPQEHLPTGKSRKSPGSNSHWPAEWVLSIDYTAPPRQTKRSADFRSPYMAMWVTDEQNKPVRTVLMVGRELDWQRDNFVWFGMNRSRSKELVQLRSLPTSVSGRYSMYWAGVDDDGKPVPVGKYTVHLETSQERGKHNYRNVTVELGRTGFRQELEKLEGSGGVELFYGHPSERFKYP